MTTVNISDYKKLYLATATEYADSLSKSCMALAEDPSNKDSINQLHISSHSLRSQSQVMSYNNMSNLTGAIETIARALLDGKFKINEKITSVLKETIVEINTLLLDIEKNNKEKNIDYLVKKLDEVSRG